jgi:hypothetical protein
LSSPGNVSASPSNISASPGKVSAPFAITGQSIVADRTTQHQGQESAERTTSSASDQ